MLHPAPLTQYIDRREPEPLVASEHERRITPAIASEVVRRRVELVAVDLDEQAILDGHVDASHPGQGNLLPDAQTPALKTLARDRFHSRIGARSRP